MQCNNGEEVKLLNYTEGVSYVLKNMKIQREDGSWFVLIPQVVSTDVVK